MLFFELSELFKNGKQKLKRSFRAFFGKAFLCRMYVENVRTERNAVKTFDFSGKYSAFKSGVDCADRHVFFILLLIRFAENLLQHAAFKKLPCRVAGMKDCLCAEIFCKQGKLFFKLVPFFVDRRAKSVAECNRG